GPSDTNLNTIKKLVPTKQFTVHNPMVKDDSSSDNTLDSNTRSSERPPNTTSTSCDTTASRSAPKISNTTQTPTTKKRPLKFD
ncbi:unnamed protein product, partial [Rotaria socialis]